MGQALAVFTVPARRAVDTPGMRIRRPLPSLVLVLAVMLGAGHVAAQRQDGPASVPREIQSQPPRAGQPTSRAEGDETIRNAVAAVVIGALSERFGDGPVAVRLDTVVVEPASIRDRVVHGEGRLQIGTEDQDWLGFRYRTLYDTFEGSAAHPRLTLGSTADDARTLVNDDALLRALDVELAQRMAVEFEGQPVRLSLDTVTTVETGARFLRLDGAGTADFGSEGRTPARVDALYDRRDKRWRHVGYELGPSAAVGDAAAPSP